MATAKQRKVLNTDYHQEYGYIFDSISKKMNTLLDLADSGEISPFELSANHGALKWLDRTMEDNIDVYMHTISKRRERQKDNLANERAQSRP
jgi:hypothetical protein